MQPTDATDYQIFTASLPLQFWWDIKKNLAHVNQHNRRHNLLGFKIRERGTHYRDFEGSHVRLAMIDVDVYAGPPRAASVGSAIHRHWRLAVSRLTRTYDHDGLQKLAYDRPRFFHTLSVLTASAAVTRINDGQWIRQEETEPNQASVDKVRDLLVDPDLYSSLVENVDRDEARAALAYYRSPRFDPGKSSYKAQLASVMQDDTVNAGNLGLVGSGVASWMRFAPADAGGNLRQLSDTTIGSPGERVERLARVDKIIPLQGNYGMNYLTLFQDRETGARMTWLNSGKQRFFEGDTYRIRGTVKDHEDRQTHMQTNLVRVTSPDLRPHIKCDEIENGKIDPRSLTLSEIMSWFKGASSMEARDEYGRSPLWRFCDLHVRTDNSYIEVIEFLCEGGCNALQDDVRGISPREMLIPLVESPELSTPSMESMEDLLQAIGGAPRSRSAGSPAIT